MQRGHPAFREAQTAVGLHTELLMNRGFAGIIPRVNAEIHTRRHSRACNRMAAPPAMLLLVPIMIFGGALITVPGAQAQAIFNPEPVGTASGTQAVTVPISTSGTVSSVAVLTGGASGLDFAAGTAPPPAPAA